MGRKDFICGKAYIDEYNRRLIYVAPYGKHLLKFYDKTNPLEIDPEAVYLNVYSYKQLKEV